MSMPRPIGIRVRGLLMLWVGALATACAAAADLPPLPTGLSAPAKAIQMPAFNLTTATGGAVRADDLRGKVVVARFWATW